MSDRCLLMHPDRGWADRGYSCQEPAAAVWHRRRSDWRMTPIPVCQVHADRLRGRGAIVEPLPN